MNDDELVNEMLKSIVKNEIRAGCPVFTEDHFFFQQVVEFMQDKRIWLGTASDLIFDMNCKAVSANTAAKLLRKQRYVRRASYNYTTLRIYEKSG